MSTAAEKNFPPNTAHSENSARRCILYRAAAIVDWRGPRGSSLLLDASGPLPRILAVGSDPETATHPAAATAQHIHLPGSLLMPGLVNAHTHLDLTHIGPQPHDPDSGFIPWIDMIRSRRCLDDAGIRASVERGIQLCLASGTIAVGDIAGAVPALDPLIPWRALCHSRLLGVSYLELFAIGNRREAGRARLTTLLAAATQPLAHAAGSEPLTPRIGLQPHAPYTVDLDVYLEAARLALAAGLPLSTHLAETPEERELIGCGTGPLRHLLETAGIWDDSILERLGRGLHPVQHLEPALAEATFTLAHLNDLDDPGLEVLSRTAPTVVYCPRAAAYFGAPRRLGPHRYRDMLQAGINVALGTDSVVNLPSPRMSILDEIRLLSRRDNTDPWLLLRMATVNGARALGLPEAWFQITPSAELAGLLAVPLGPAGGLPGPTWPGDPQQAFPAILNSEAPPALLLLGNHSRQTRNLPVADAPKV